MTTRSDIYNNDGSVVTNEPVMIWTALPAALLAILNCLVLFGVDWTAEQIAGINAAFIAVLAIPLAILARSKVTPVANPDLGSVHRDDHHHVV